MRRVLEAARRLWERFGGSARPAGGMNWLGGGGSELHQRGWRAEDFAAADLTRRGYHILERNLVIAGGEIDIVAEHERRLVFIEVRSRQERSPIRPIETLTEAKKRRILRCGQAYIRRHHLSPRDCRPRYDIAEVYLTPEGYPTRCDVLVNVLGADFRGR